MHRQHAILLATFLIGVLVDMITIYWLQVGVPTGTTFGLVLVALGLTIFILLKKGGIHL